MNLDKQTPIVRSLHVITRDYIGAFTHKLTHLDIERHFYTLVLIENGGKCISQQDLAQNLAVDKVTISRVIDYLVKNKYVVRSKHPTDRRAHHLKLTGKAIKILPEIKNAISELNKAAIQGLTKMEVACFLKVAERIHLNLVKLPVDQINYKFKKIEIKKK